MSWLSLLGLDRVLVRLRRINREVTEAVEDRLELARIEWHEEVRNVRRVLSLGVAVGILATVTLVAFGMAVTVHFWDTPYRKMAVWIMAFAWLAVLIVAVLLLLRYWGRSANAFALTRQELAEDWRQLKEKL